MSLFLSTTINKIDKKFRVSVPAPFRTALAQDAGDQAAGIVLFRSLHHPALEGCSVKHLEILSASLERLNLTPEMYELIETTIFGGSVQLPIDGDGRVILPSHFADAVGLSEEAAFVGRRRTFQIWNPAAYSAYEEQARTSARTHNISLSKIIADAAALPPIMRGDV
jgi:MraZ protein